MTSNVDGPVLLSEKKVADLLAGAPSSGSHGARSGYLGSGLLYYGIVYMLRADLCVCIGSAGGFVPRIMRQAQRDLGGIGETHLVDADLPEAGWGKPQCLAEDSSLRRHFPEVRIHLMTSFEAEGLFEGRLLDYVHVDGDHSYEGCRRDVEAYCRLLGKNGLMTVHDTMLHRTHRRSGVQRVVRELRESTRFDVLELPQVGTGVAIVRPR